MIVSRPKSARRTVPVSSISMFALTVKLVRTAKQVWQGETHSFEIPVNHPVAMEVDQSLSDACQLGYFQFSSKRVTKRRTYEPELVDFRMCLDELIDVSVHHPL